MKDLKEKKKLLKEELDLINQNSSQKERDEANRFNALSESERILENIEYLKIQRDERQLDLDQLQEDKEREQVILEALETFKEQAETSRTNIKEAETEKRKKIMDSEIAKIKELIALQREA